MVKIKDFPNFQDFVQTLTNPKKLWYLFSFSCYNESASAMKERCSTRRGDVCACVCGCTCMCVWQRNRVSGRDGERVFSPIRSFTQPSRGASRVPHCSPKASTRRHCCCAASALNPPPTPPHRKQGYCPRDVTSETPTPARLLALAPSRPQPIAMTTEKRIEYKWVLKRQRDQRDRAKEGWRDRERQRGEDRGTGRKSGEEQRRGEEENGQSEREVNEWAGKGWMTEERMRLREREEACGGMWSGEREEERERRRCCGCCEEEEREMKWREMERGKEGKEGRKEGGHFFGNREPTSCSHSNTAIHEILTCTSLSLSYSLCFCLSIPPPLLFSFHL